MKIIKIVIVISSIFIFISCGGGTPPVEQEPMKKLFLIDSPINGIDYECGVRKDKSKRQIVDGVDKDGVVNCRKGAVTFKIGDLIIGKLDKYKDTQEIYLQDLITISQDTFNNTELLKLGMFIQSIDDDGDINQTINITDEIKEKINIKSLDDMNISDVQEYLIKLGKTPRDISDVREHIIKYSGIPYIQDLNITITDNTDIGTVIASLDITNSDNLSNIEIIKGDYRDYFYISKIEKTIQLNKKVNYKDKYLYSYQIQATNSKGKSNIAMININITTKDIESMKDISKAELGKNIIYTKDDSYNIKIEAKEGVKVYFDGVDINQTVDKTGMITIDRDILANNIREEHSIVLGYNNGTKSEPKLFVIINDTIKPIITTSTNLSVEENVKIVTHIDIEDINKNYGLEYFVSGLDSKYFDISEIGELSFRDRPDYEMPLDENGDNIYEIEVKVSDKSENTTSKKLKIEVIDVLDFLPIIYELNMDISISENVGNIIVQIPFTSGSSKVTEITLSGQGADKFKVNTDGTVVLLQKITEATIFKLMVNITNKYGTTSKEITLNMINSGRLGVVELGNLSNATLKIIKLNYDTNQEELIYTEKTTKRGIFDTHSKELEYDSFYIFEITDGIINNSTHNQGVLRLIAKGEWIKQLNNTMRITPLSEMQYIYIVKYIKNVDSFDYNKIEMILDKTASILLDKDLNGDMIINTKDILIFNPITNQDNLYKTIKKDNLFKKITDKIIGGDSSYVKDLFLSSIIQKFGKIYDIKVEGSFAYIYGDNHFYIYDIKNQVRVGEVYLPKTYDDSYSFSYFIYAGTIDLRPKIYLDLNNNIVYISSLDEYTIGINIEDINSPEIESKYIVGAGKYIVKKYNNMLFFTQGIPYILSQDNLDITINDNEGNPGVAYINGDNHPSTKDSKIEYTLGDSVAIDISNPNNLVAYNHIPFLNTIINYQNKLIGYDIFEEYIGYNSSCLLDYEYYINTYDISEIEKEQNLITTTYKMYNCNSSDYFDRHGYFYKLNYYTHELSIYNFFKNQDSVIGYLKIPEDNDLSNILNRYGDTLYFSAIVKNKFETSKVVSFVNILEPTKPYIYDKLSMGFLWASFQFYGNIFVSGNYIYDTNSFRYAAPYTRINVELENIEEAIETIDLDPFQRFQM